jgi:hypothetical protein
VVLMLQQSPGFFPHILQRSFMLFVGLEIEYGKNYDLADGHKSWIGCWLLRFAKTGDRDKAVREYPDRKYVESYQTETRPTPWHRLT